MIMKYLAIVRHGEFSEGETKLNKIGKEQMLNLVPLLEPLNPCVYSSTGPRSIESASILAEVLNKEFEPIQFFGSRTRGEEVQSYRDAYRFLDVRIENVLVVTKGEWANEFIPYFCKKALNLDVSVYSLERGTGVLIDCGKKILKPLP